MLPRKKIYDEKAFIGRFKSIIFSVGIRTTTENVE